MQTFRRLTEKAAEHKLVLGSGSSFFIENGSLWVCGNNYYGQLGLGEDDGCNAFTRLELSERVLQVSNGGLHTALITESGQLWVCGHNYNGQLGLGDNRHRDTFTRVNSIPEPVKQIAAGNHYTTLLTESGQLWVCGNNYCGQLGLGDWTIRNVFTRVDLPEVVRTVSAGERDIALITESGQLWFCGDNKYGQVGLGGSLNLVTQLQRFTQVELPEPVKQIALGHVHIALITESGQLWVSGDNEEGQLGVGDNRNRDVFTRVELSERVLQISAGQSHTALLTESGQLLVSGNNEYGQLGLNDYNRRNNFTYVESPEALSQIRLGNSHTMGLTAHGQAWFCGRNGHKGCLGLTDNNDRVILTRIALPEPGYS